MIGQVHQLRMLSQVANIKYVHHEMILFFYASSQTIQPFLRANKILLKTLIALHEYFGHVQKFFNQQLHGVLQLIQLLRVRL